MIFWISKITYPGIHQHYKFLFRSILHSRHIYIFPLRRCLFVRSISQLIHKHMYLIYRYRNFQGNQNRWNILESYILGGHHRKFIDMKYVCQCIIITGVYLYNNFFDTFAGSSNADWLILRTSTISTTLCNHNDHLQNLDGWYEYWN